MGPWDFRVGIAPTPSCKCVAYCVFARSNSDCRSTALVHFSRERCRSRDDNRWKTRTQPSRGQEKTSVDVLAFEESFRWVVLDVGDLNPPAENGTLSQLYPGSVGKQFKPTVFIKSDQQVFSDTRKVCSVLPIYFMARLS